MEDETMFYAYTKRQEGNKYHFSRNYHITLGGNKWGVIREYLDKTKPSRLSVPYKWHFPIEKGLKQLEYDENSILIDAKPHKEGNVSLYEILDIWGYTTRTWTPILLRLKALLVDEEASYYDKKQFKITGYPNIETVLTFLYLRGGIYRNSFFGTWNFPGPSPTN